MNNNIIRFLSVSIIAAVLALSTAGLLRAQTEHPSDESQEEVLESLLDSSATKPLIITSEIPDRPTTDAVKPVDPKAKPPLTVRENDFVSNRLGRLVTGERGLLLFAYEADAANLSEPPLILLPCRNLEFMEKQLAKQPAARFIVSGEITVYKGRAYFLLRKANLERDMGQF